MSKRKKKLLGIGVAFAICIVVLLFSFFLVPYKETANGSTELIQKENLKKIKETWTAFAQKGTDTVTIDEAVPFEWDTIAYKNNSYKFYNEHSVICSIPENGNVVKMIFDYCGRTTISRSEQYNCDLTVCRGVPELRICNYETQQKVTKPDQNKMKGRYGYDVTATNKDVVDTSNRNVLYYLEDSNKLTYGLDDATLSLDTGGMPVLYYNSKVSRWNEKGNYWKTKKMKSYPCGSYTSVYPVGHPTKYKNNKEKYAAITSDGELRLLILDDTYKKKYEVGLTDFEKLDLPKGAMHSAWDIGDVDWLRDDTYLIELKSVGGKKAAETKTDVERKAYQGIYAVCDFSKPKGEQIRVKSYSKSYLLTACSETKGYFLTENKTIEVVNLSDMSVIETIPLQGVKLAASDYQGGISQDEWLDWYNLFSLTVYKNNLYLISKKGLYRYDLGKKKWKLIMDATYLPSLRTEREGIKKICMLSENEFYVLLGNNNGSMVGRFLHYKRTRTEPANFTDEDYVIRNSAMTKFHGAADKVRRLDPPDGVRRIVAGAFDRKTESAGRNISLRLTSKYALDPFAFSNCMPMRIQVSDNKRTLHAFYYSQAVIGSATIEVLVPARLRRFDAEGMTGNVIWNFAGGPPKLINYKKEDSNFKQILVPEGCKEAFCKAFGLTGGKREKVVESSM